MREPCLDYFYGDKVKVDSFCRLPRIFVTDEFYRTIPAEIKVLYSLMLDRVAMSMRNNWREDGRVFIYFTLEEAMRRVHAGRHKAIGLFRRMETLGLIRRRKQERGKPDRIFVREFREVENWEEPPAEDAANRAATETASVDIFPETADSAERPVTVMETNGTPAQVDTGSACADSETPKGVRGGLCGLLHECAAGVRRLGDLLLGGGVPEAQTSRNETSRLPFSGSQDFPKPHPNYTNTKYKELFDYNQSIHRERTAITLREEDDDSEQAKAARKEESMEILRGLIRDNIDYEGLMRDYPKRRGEIAGYVEMMARVCCSERREIRINQHDVPKDCVQSRFEKLERKHMEYVLKCMARLSPEIRNIRAYALSTLYNSYVIPQRGHLSWRSRKNGRKHYKNWHDANE